MENQSLCTIKPIDFTRNKKDQEWSGGYIRHIMKAADGREVLIEVDKITGHTIRGSIVGVRRAPDSYGFTQVVVEHGDKYKTAFLLFKCGNIIAPSDVKWTSIKSHMMEGSEALDQARDEIEAKYESEEWIGGRWECSPTMDEGIVHLAYHLREKSSRRERLVWHGSVIIEKEAAL